jgi:hypothetical protein
MENTTITPTYKVSVTFNWHYADKSVRKIQKGGYITESGTQDEVVQKFLDTFMHSYIVGICKVEDVKVHRFDRILTVDEWMDKYNPIKNHIDEGTSFGGTSFETYDEELEFVQSQNPYNIWTLVCAEDEYYIVPGFRWVNRENYFVTEKPFTDENLHEEYLVI